MSAQENKAIACRFVEEVWNRDRMDVACELVTSDAVNHDPLVPEDLLGPDGSWQGIRALRTAFPDFHARIEDVIAEGDRVALRLSCSGTSTSGCWGTGGHARWDSICIMRVEGGRIAELWGWAGPVELLIRLALPTPRVSGGDGQASRAG